MSRCWKFCKGRIFYFPLRNPGCEVTYTSSLLQQRSCYETWLPDYQTSLKLPPLTLLAGSAPAVELVHMEEIELISIILCTFTWVLSLSKQLRGELAGSTWLNLWAWVGQPSAFARREFKAGAKFNKCTRHRKPHDLFLLHVQSSSVARTHMGITDELARNNHVSHSKSRNTVLRKRILHFNEQYTV